MEMNEATRAAVEQMRRLAEEAARDALARREAGEVERARLCEAQAGAFTMAIGILVEEHAARCGLHGRRKWR